VEQQEWQALQVTAQRLGLHLQSLNVLQVRNPDDFEALFAEAVRERADALQTLNCIHNNLAPHRRPRQGTRPGGHPRTQTVVESTML